MKCLALQDGKSVLKMAIKGSFPPFYVSICLHNNYIKNNTISLTHSKLPSLQDNYHYNQHATQQHLRPPSSDHCGSSSCARTPWWRGPSTTSTKAFTTSHQPSNRMYNSASQLIYLGQRLIPPPILELLLFWRTILLLPCQHRWWRWRNDLRSLHHSVQLS
jgi:hypothetical protein